MWNELFFRILPVGTLVLQFLNPVSLHPMFEPPWTDHLNPDHLNPNPVRLDLGSKCVGLGSSNC